MDYSIDIEGVRYTFSKKQKDYERACKLCCLNTNNGGKGCFIETIKQSCKDVKIKAIPAYEKHYHFYVSSIENINIKKKNLIIDERSEEEKEICSIIL